LGERVGLLRVVLDQPTGHDQVAAHLFGEVARQPAQFGPHLARQLRPADVGRDLRFVDRLAQPGRCRPLAPPPVAAASVVTESVTAAPVTSAAPIRATPIIPATPISPAAPIISAERRPAPAVRSTPIRSGPIRSATTFGTAPVRAN